jgi:mannosyltransferase
VTTYTNPNLNPPSLSRFISHSWQAYTLGLTIDFERVRPYLWFIAALCLAGLIVHRRDRRFTALLGWFLVPMGLYFIALQRQPSYQPRYLMLATPSIFLLLALTLTFRKWTHGLGLVVVAIFALGLYSYFNDPTYFKDDAEAVTQWLMRETTPDDIVFVDVPHPFHYYADHIPAPTRYLFVDIHTAADTLNQEALGRDRLYWVTWWGSDTDPRGVIPYLLQKQAGPSRGEARFPGYHLVWYQLSDRPFSLPNDLAPLEVNFDHGLRLDGLAYSQTLSPGESAWAALHFTQLAPIEVNYKVSLRLRAPEGALLAQQDKAILNDRHFQTAAWPVDDPALNQAINVYTLSLDDPTYVGPLTLEAVVYDAETLAAVAAYGVSTTSDDFVSAQIGEIEVR